MRPSDLRFLPCPPLLLLLLPPLLPPPPPPVLGPSCPNTESELTTIVSVKLEVVNFGENPSLPIVIVLLGSCFESDFDEAKLMDGVDVVVSLAGCTMGFNWDDTFSDLESFL